ncbi:host attachment family protein [Phaeovulum sp.]|uniref:host attachment family protein n=1 Tax=Phaeovulum sp. TaxID=2934796 RepID=UPI002731DB1E|nr:host attachment family protein [Phaeovulum sp.]MDP1670254.1 host attachment family protein [Phaeovulum sp.]MDZ4120250.1 host attachment family protein [Phaeovulum sp.]
MLLTNGFWVVVADGEKALVLENVGDVKRAELRLVRREEANLEIPGADTFPPGRVYESASGIKVSAHEQTDYARLAGERFAVELVAMLAAAAKAGRFERLVLAAPPQVLGALRAAMSPDLRACVVAELPKTLTNHPVTKIAALVSAEIDTL